jgi:hypothetical protein
VSAAPVGAALVGVGVLLGAMLAVLRGVALAAVVDVGGAVAVVVTDGELGVWHAASPAMAAALMNAVNRIRADIRLLRVLLRGVAAVDDVHVARVVDRHADWMVQCVERQDGTPGGQRQATSAAATSPSPGMEFRHRTDMGMALRQQRVATT